MQMEKIAYFSILHRHRFNWFKQWLETFVIQIFYGFINIIYYIANVICRASYLLQYVIKWRWFVLSNRRDQFYVRKTFFFEESNFRMLNLFVEYFRKSPSGFDIILCGLFDVPDRISYMVKVYDVFHS